MSTEDQNLIHLVDKRRTLWRCGGAILSAILLILAYPPFSFSYLAWIALIPILLVPVPATRWRRFLLGYLFGYAYSVVNLYWLNTIGFAAGIFLAFYTALWPALWYFLSMELLKIKETDIPIKLVQHLTIPRQWLWIFASASIWVLTEYTRSYLFTGFSWNQLGISQWNRPSMLILSALCGVYGLSFILAITNINLALLICPNFNIQCSRTRLQRRAQFLPTALLLVAVAFFSRQQMNQLFETYSPTQSLKILGVQGNIPQCRNASDEEFYFARDTYISLTRQALNEQETDLVVWPESAVPSSIYYSEVWNHLYPLFKLQPCQWLIGSIDFRMKTGNDYECFNSAMQFNHLGQKINSYDKIHIVPFGEFVPFSQYLPFLENIFGMGRSLTPGNVYTIFDLPNGAKGGVNICYEDAYPEISRRFTLNGANLLLTLTNDAWYAESAGPEQHYVHAIFRAVENRRPLFRSGNNSDTCLIMPNGQTVQRIIDPYTESRFHRSYDFFEVPVMENPPLTFYTRYGDWPMLIALLLALIAFSDYTYAVVHSKKISQIPDPDHSLFKQENKEEQQC